MADQLRADALGCFGNSFARTPELDALAARGARLNAHITPNQICAPSRASLFSGLYARNHGLVHNGIALRDDLELITHALARCGISDTWNWQIPLPADLGARGVPHARIECILGADRVSQAGMDRTMASTRPNSSSVRAPPRRSQDTMGAGSEQLPPMRSSFISGSVRSMHHRLILMKSGNARCRSTCIIIVG